MDPLNQQPQINPGQSTGGSATPEQMAKLQELMDKVESKYQDFNSAKLSAGNQNEDQNNDALRELFDMLTQAGIDPSNPDEIQAFLDKVKVADPEMFQRLEAALGALLGKDTGAVEAEVPDPNAPPQDAFPEGQNMNIQNANPSENL